MNISELIVEHLKQGKPVEIPGMGTLKSVLREPYHDPTTSTYYPAGHTVILTDQKCVDASLIPTIAARECVNENVAAQMWHNYTDALEDKLRTTGSHTFTGLGTIARVGDKYFFSAAEDLELDASNGRDMPLHDVKTYDHAGEEDPFAQFEDAEAKAAEEEAARIAEEERQRLEAEAEAERERLAAEEAERQRLAAEEAERERLAAEEAERDRLAAEEAERQRLAAEEAERQRLAAEEAERQRLEAEAKAERQRLAAEEAERQRFTTEERPVVESIVAEKTAIPDSEPRTEEPAPETGEKKQKKSRWWILLLLLLLLLLLGAGAYCYFKGIFPSKQATVTAPFQDRERVDAPATNDLTFNTDLIEYSDREMMRTSDLVCFNMAEYINGFLTDRGYTSARVPMMERVRQYSNQRMIELLGERFAVQRFIPYDDYVYKYNEPYLKYVYANRSRVKVQSELMDEGLLDEMLRRMIDELGLKPDGAGAAPKTAAEVQEVKAAERREIETRRQAAVEKQQSAPVNVNVARDSKQGFDIIAGCYLNRQTATKMTARLHELGCDAYIIEKNDLFYVSMGSAATRTSAESLFHHIKSWYDGDVVIKEW